MLLLKSTGALNQWQPLNDARDQSNEIDDTDTGQHEDPGLLWIWIYMLVTDQYHILSFTVGQVRLV